MLRCIWMLSDTETWVYSHITCIEDDLLSIRPYVNRNTEIELQDSVCNKMTAILQVTFSIFLYQKCCILIQISFRFVPRASFIINGALVWTMAFRNVFSVYLYEEKHSFTHYYNIIGYICSYIECIGSIPEEYNLNVIWNNIPVWFYIYVHYILNNISILPYRCTELVFIFLSSKTHFHPRFQYEYLYVTMCKMHGWFYWNIPIKWNVGQIENQKKVAIIGCTSKLALNLTIVVFI